MEKSRSEIIKFYMKKLGMKTVMDLHRRLKEAYEGEKVITHPTLSRILKDEIKNMRVKTASQLASVLGCLTSEIYQEKTNEIPGIYKKYETQTRKDGFVRKRCVAQILSINDKLAIDPQRIHLSYGGRTPTIKPEKGSDKLIFVYKGKMNLHLLHKDREKVITLKNPQQYTFSPSIPHYYEGLSRRGGCHLVSMKNP
ncbi:MAG: helix-turn-helix domain-containing protein [Candidatus Omnitrophica bacterium]|nr:helix-turn-helix domain-containing protein [Candidatus Omnitrophota bacterium]